jgi:hypothetical protein
MRVKTSIIKQPVDLLYNVVAPLHTGCSTYSTFDGRTSDDVKKDQVKPIDLLMLLHDLLNIISIINIITWRCDPGSAHPTSPLESKRILTATSTPLFTNGFHCCGKPVRPEELGLAEYGVRHFTPGTRRRPLSATLCICR